MKIRALILPRRVLRCQRGAMAVEFAFAAPVFFAMLYAIVEFGRMFYVQAILRYAAEQTARYAMAEYTRTYWTDNSVADSALIATIETNALANASNYVYGWDASTITFTASTETAGDPDFLVINADYTFQFLVPFFPVPDIDLHAESRVPMAKSSQ